MYAGIYCIENVSNKKIYIGQSKNIEKRLSNHRYLLEIGKHYNIHLQNSYNKYGKRHFSFRILEKAEDLKTLNKLEQKWISHHKSFDAINGYNIQYPTKVLRQCFRGTIWKECKICGIEYGLYKWCLDYDRFQYQNLCSPKCWRIYTRRWQKSIDKDEISIE